MGTKRHFPSTTSRILELGPGGFDTEIFVGEFCKAQQISNIGYSDVQSELLEGIQTRIDGMSDELAASYHGRVSSFVNMAEGILAYQKWQEDERVRELDRRMGISD